MITLLLGTPVLCLLGAVGASLLVGVRHPGLLLPVLIMPLYIPVIIFGTGTVIAAAAQLPVNGYFALMGAFVLLSLAFAPLLTGLALRIGVTQ
jgi:heme exporter protein B